MLPLLLLGLGGGALYLINQKQRTGGAASSASSSRTGASTSANTRRPSPELLSELHSILTSENRAETLAFAASECERLGYQEEAAQLRAKESVLRAAAANAVAPSDATSEVQVDASDNAAAEELAQLLVTDARQNGSWVWNVDAVKSFQKKMSLKETGLFDVSTIAAVNALVPESAGLWTNSGLLQMKMSQPGASTDINEADLHNMFLSGEYTEGREKAKSQESSRAEA